MGPKIDKRLIITSDDAASGYLKHRFKTHDVYAICHRLVRDPVPNASNIRIFFEDRRTMLQADPSQFGSWINIADKFSADRLEIIVSKWDYCSTIEFWVDPDPNSQLVLLQTLNWILAEGLDYEKLRLVHGQVPFGLSGSTSDPEPTYAPVYESDLKCAQTAWSAFCQPTPEAWEALSRDDLSYFPFLRRTVGKMLEELPDVASGLGASETRILSLVETGNVPALTVFQEYKNNNDYTSPLLYWEIGKVIDLLAQDPAKTILGLSSGPFNMVGQDEASRYSQYMASSLSLSNSGKLIASSLADFARIGRINRWWGGTYLTNEKCWRWSAKSKCLTQSTGSMTS
jgi:hypothetical protein